MYKKGFFSSIADAIQFANEENVKIISLLPIHYNANSYADKYALVYQEQMLEGFFPLFIIYYIHIKSWHGKVQVFSLDQEMQHYFKITIYKIKKIVYN